MSDLAGPRVHPPLRVLELAELVLDGALPPVDLGLAPGTVLEDAEGVPVAVLDPDGRPRPARPFTHGPLRAHRSPPAPVREALGGYAGDAPVPAVLVEGPLSEQDVDRVVAAADGSPVLWLVSVGDGRGRDLPPAQLWRSVQALVADLPVASVVVAVAVPAGVDVDPVARAYGAGVVLHPDGDGPAHPAFARGAARYPGATILLTGLSGSGKSTVAKALVDRLEQGEGAFAGRTVSLLDGDEVRRMLSAGLGFSRADRDLNIQRIGWVAAEITRHGGLAVCAPIAPFEATRAEVAQRVRRYGRFVLVHVSTPLAECERRDRKGLYAQARAGQIADFTGISSPYEEPAEPDLRLDTTDLSIEQAVDAVWQVLRRADLLTPLP
jgi:sulfate adenylyltransferase